ncbi:3'-5' exonuclease [Mucilaginibacter pedocola]|uniref:DNA polymerase III subunit epsilon n=1 Tax=Mucilaginibacter pedocola TaxID=1792845 RepID=A0A1S9PF42_9SPHI|nr:3'-5' exonuclease [Mucilaginibacter pedocola]OOQ59581.1 DNA polymerase III subunit epsilon [Mucilaginibacter pedocola]
MKLNLKRPLAFFDLETTGTNIGTDRIVEISVIKMNPDGSEEVMTWRVNPGIAIPLESSLVHGIYDEHVQDEKRFQELANSVAEFIGEADLAGYNSNKFDIPMLMEEFLRAGVVFDLENRFFVDVQNIFHQMEQRTLKAAYKFYCDKDIINAHSAEADTRATMEVLIAQVERYVDTEFEDKKGNRSKPVTGDIEDLHKFTNLSRPVDFAGRMVYDEEGHETINFGKHKGRRVEDVLNAEPSYYSWMMQGDFPLYTKRKLEEVYKRWNAKKNAERQANKPAQPAAPKPDAPRPNFANNAPRTSPQINKPYNNNQNFKKKDEPAKPVDNDMLAALKNKFGKA